MTEEKWLVDLYGAHQAFCRLGFRSEDLYFGFGDVVNVGQDVVFMHLETQGQEFNLAVCQLPFADEETLFAKWQAFADRINNSSPEYQDKMWRESHVGKDTDTFLALTCAIAHKGFKIPVLPDEMVAEVAKATKDLIN